MAKVTVGQFRRSVRQRVERVKKLAAFKLWNGVTAKTPVLTGRARAAWNIAAGSADLSVPPEAETHSAPTLPPIGNIPAGTPIVVSNNLPYIRPLEKGSSRQAPEGMAQITFNEVKGEVRDIIAGVKRQAEAGA